MCSLIVRVSVAQTREWLDSINVLTSFVKTLYLSEPLFRRRATQKVEKSQNQIAIMPLHYPTKFEKRLRSISLNVEILDSFIGPQPYQLIRSIICGAIGSNKENLYKAGQLYYLKK